MSDRDRPLLAVLIDADNVPAKHAAKIMREVASIGEPALRRVYGDWSNEQLKGWKDPIHHLGLVAHQETANSRGKNATDIGLVIHAMDILHSGKFDAFVIVSSDSDFTALVNRLREDGLTVIGIGEAKTLDGLRNVYNRFILIENIPDPDAPADTPRKSTAKAAKALPLFREAFDKIDSEDDWYNLGQIGQAIQARHPDFDSRTYGFGKLSALVNALDKLETKKTGNRLLVRLKA
ncbi:NYN domain-containing protein [Sulfitobacter aestuariivivens]|uniref:NYN domain-containing protein n=1 Tax=Sulfitobacter aestuariivivens TaxID=2766981 RepID=A0A927HEI1_9RHOB|nr:NYN domain-containing protein [Sulfitobacter aestuariivivens]MBD3663413.1 NYN domain-containing protein [Sulfitobacter aestuariivivens]